MLRHQGMWMFLLLLLGGAATLAAAEPIHGTTCIRGTLPTGGMISVMTYARAYRAYVQFLLSLAAETLPLARHGPSR